MYRIFINENLLILCSSVSKLKINESFEVLNYNGEESILIAIKKAQINSLIILGKDIEIMWREFCSNYKIIIAAGGIILNNNGHVLWIFRNGKWDLPKGKVERGESIISAARREVQEECGIENISLGGLLGKTYHTYEHKGIYILKESNWYEMTCNEIGNLKPQFEEGITKVIWVDNIQYKKCLANTYSSISELLNREKVLHYLDF